MTAHRESAPVVVGAGIAGLSAAWELSRNGGAPVVLEASDDAGGKLRTTPLGETLLDEAADAFLSRVPWAVDLCRELGLEAELVHPAARAALIWAPGAADGTAALHPLPSPNVLGIPLDPSSIDGTGLLSTDAADALRADLDRTDPDPVLPDDTIGSLVRRRLGDEVFEKLVSALLGSINAGDCDRLSVHASAPQIAAAAHRNPSLLRGLLDARKASDPDAPVFAAHPGGMRTIIDALVQQSGADVRLNAAVEHIAPTSDGLELRLSDGSTVAAPSCVLTVPANRAATIVSEWPEAAEHLRSIPFVSVVLVSMAFSADDIGELPDGISGFLVPHADGGPTITACSFTSNKWAHLGGGDHHLLRVSLGHRGQPEIEHWSDEQILQTVAHDLKTTLGIDAPPAAVRITRWPRSFPQYEADHLDRISAAETVLRSDGIHLAGMSYRGIGIPASIHHARAAARAAVAKPIR